MRIDAAAVGLSGLCLVHCLALPVFAATSPLIAVLADNEWLHRGLVAIALPIALFAFTRMADGRSKAIFGLMAATGSILLAAGAFVEPLHDHETLLTALGAALLASAHILRWRSHQV